MRSTGPDPVALFRLRGIEHQRRQAAEVRRLWPMLVAHVKGTRFEVSGEVQPTPLSEIYRVRVIYVFGEAPRSYVDEPALRPRDDGSPIPHIYRGPRPCLYLPGGGEWTGTEMIAGTIIPWLLLWLTYYELWHATGVWQGGGEHPEDSDENGRLNPSSGTADDPPAPSV